MPSARCPRALTSSELQRLAWRQVESPPADYLAFQPAQMPRL